MPRSEGCITEVPSPENGFRLGLDPKPEPGKGETLHLDWEEMVYAVVPEDDPSPEVPEQRIEQWWLYVREVSRREGLDKEAIDACDALEQARRRGARHNFTGREVRMLDEIERLRRLLDPSREIPGWGSRTWEPGPGEADIDRTRR